MSTQALQKSQQAKLQLERALLGGKGARGEMMKRVGGAVSPLLQLLFLSNLDMYSLQYFKVFELELPREKLVNVIGIL